MSQASANPETVDDTIEVTAPSVYEMIREDIVSGRLGPNERLKVAELAERYETSTNPVREALQQLRGEGFVLMEPNRGARVRPIDADFVRDIIEIEVLIEPALTRWFVSIAGDSDIIELEAIQAEIEANNFEDRTRHGQTCARSLGWATAFGCIPSSCISESSSAMPSRKNGTSATL